MVGKVIFMEPISEVLGNVVAGLVAVEARAGRQDRAWMLEQAAAEAGLSPLDDDRESYVAALLA
jgi:hypothetical protein